jgi:hypothetical protein
MGDFAGGYAVVKGDKRVCHPNAQDRPDCYTLITVYNEVLGVRLDETLAGIQKTETAQAFLSRTLMH